jgi:AbrB family looped-hinge helix DNA binding protein
MSYQTATTHPPIVKVNQNYQVTIPAVIRRKYNIVIQDLIEFIDTKAGILLKPKMLLDKAPEMSLKLKKADLFLPEKDRIKAGLDDIKRGRVSGPYNNIDNLLRDLKS